MVLDPPIVVFGLNRRPGIEEAFEVRVRIVEQRPIVLNA